MLVSAKEMLTKAKEGHYAVGPFQIVDVELTYCVVSFLCFGKHFFCRN